MSARTRLWNGCAFWALQAQHQLPTDTAGALSKAHAHGHSPCRNKASPHAVTRINHKLVTAPCCGEIKSVPTWRKCCRTFGCRQHSLASTLHTLLPLTLRWCPAPHWAAAEAEALLCPTTPNKPETKPVLLTNRFICILTAAQILDTDFFCTTVQEPVQNMLFLLFIHVQKTPKPNKCKDEECGSIYLQLVCLSLPSTHLHSPLPIMPTLWPPLPASNSCTVSEEW